MNEIVLREHALNHIRELKVDPALMRAQFHRECSMTRCIGKCCATGVWADVAEHDAIVRHAELIQAGMDGSQERDPARWFDAEQLEDRDFPSGRAIGTAVANGACVFLGTDRRCVLQKVSNAQTGSLKPFFCFAFPVTIDDGTLCLDEARDAACCTTTPEGPLTVFDLCTAELEYVLGSNGMSELRARAGGETR
jgi:Fe-S-cluster containining protein